MRVLAVASEAYPLVKTGGLADVAGALPQALASHGVAVRTLIPVYREVMAQIAEPVELCRIDDLLGVQARLVGATLAGLDLILLDAPALYDRPGGPYADGVGRDHPDNALRFAALARAGVLVAAGALPGWRPHLVHAHDWQAGLLPAYLRYGGIDCPSVMTVHNLAFQGRFPTAVFASLGLPPRAFALEGVEYYGGVGFLKAGLATAQAITTVSPTYAAEIATPAFGMGLEGLIASRSKVLSGIVNGIDTAAWDPECDPHLPATYAARSLGKRRVNQTALEARLGLEPGKGPIFCVISRLTWQKGMDLFAEVAGGLVAAGARLAVLGTGEAALEAAFRGLAVRHPGRIGVEIGYDEALAHLMQGAADAIVIPSRFEPCGLTQLYGLRYGCVPVVARTGGLADTVIDANEAALTAGVATGLLFAPGEASALARALDRAVALHEQTELWTTMQRQGMKADVSWDRSAARYAALYASLLEGPPA